MKRTQTYEAADEGAITAPLRNVRVHLDGTSAIVDLIPSNVLDNPIDKNDPDLSPELNKILTGAKPIVEATRFMRVHFDWIVALAVQDEFVEIIPILNVELKKAPRLSDPDDLAPYPFLRVIDSTWKHSLPDYQGRDNPDLNHFKILSMETCVDILGQIEKIEWMEQD